MSPEDVNIFRSISNLSATLWEDLESLDPDIVAKNSGAEILPDKGYRLTYMNGDYVVDLKARDIQGPADHLAVGFQKGMVLLSYLAKAQDLGLSGRMVGYRELNGGEMFFTGPHTLLTSPLTEKFANKASDFLKKASLLGMQSNSEGSSYCCQGKILPNIAVACIFYEEDDEYPAELTYTFDSYAHYHLALDGIWAMINVLAEELAA